MVISLWFNESTNCEAMKHLGFAFVGKKSLFLLGSHSNAQENTTE